MKILYFHLFNLGSGWGGSASMLRAFLGELKRLGHTVDVVSAHRPDPYGFTICALPFDSILTFGPEKRPGEITLDEIPTAELEQMAKTAAEVIEREVFSQGLPDLLIANHINLTALICWHLHQKWGIPYRIISYGTDTQLLLRDRRYCELFGRAARDAERLFAISKYIAQEIERTVGGTMEVLGGAMDPTLFFPAPPTLKTSSRLVYFGRLVTEKGIWTLLEAFQRQTTATELVIIGEGPLRGEIEAYLQRTLIPGSVQLRGYLPQAQLREELIQAAAVVVPSTWQEPLGLVVMEALACGIPVIASAVGGIPEMIDSGKNGWLVEGGNVAALAEAIDTLLSQPAMYDEIKKQIALRTIPTYADLARQLIR